MFDTDIALTHLEQIEHRYVSGNLLLDKFDMPCNGDHVTFYDVASYISSLQQVDSNNGYVVLRLNSRISIERFHFF